METHFGSIDEARISKHLEMLLRSKCFRSAPRLCEFLRFIVTETLAGRGGQLKEFSIGVTAFHRRSDFDPKQDSIVRVEAVKLRARLAEHYSTSSVDDGVVISLEKGSYVPSFRICRSFRDSSDPGLLAHLIASGDLAVWRRTTDGIAIALRNFSRAIAMEPCDPRGYIGVAETCRSALDMELDSPATIIPRFERNIAESLRLSPASCPARVLRSNLICVARGIGLDALKEIDTALLLDSSNARAHFWRAAVLSALNRHTEAIRQIREAVRLEPQSALFHAYLGRILLYAGEKEGAIEQLSDIVQLDPALSAAQLWLALALIESEKFDEAVAVTSSMNALTDNSAPKCCLAYVLARAGYQADAARLLEELTSSAKRYVSPVWLSAIYTALEAHGKAAMQIQTALEERSYPLIWLRTDPRLKTWREDCRANLV